MELEYQEIKERIIETILSEAFQKYFYDSLILSLNKPTIAETRFCFVGILFPLDYFPEELNHYKSIIFNLFLGLLRKNFPEFLFSIHYCGKEDWYLHIQDNNKGLNSKKIQEYFRRFH